MYFQELQIPLDLAGTSSQSYLTDLCCKCSHSLKWVNGFVVSFVLDIKLGVGLWYVYKERENTG